MLGLAAEDVACVSVLWLWRMLLPIFGVDAAYDDYGFGRARGSGSGWAMAWPEMVVLGLGLAWMPLSDDLVSYSVDVVLLDGSLGDLLGLGRVDAGDAQWADGWWCGLLLMSMCDEWSYYGALWIFV